MNILTRKQLETIETAVEQCESVNNLLYVFRKGAVDIIEDGDTKEHWKRADTVYLTLMAQYIIKKAHPDATTKFTCADLHDLMDSCCGKASLLPDDFLSIADEEDLRLYAEWLEFVTQTRGQNPGRSVSCSMILGFTRVLPF